MGKSTIIQSQNTCTFEFLILSNFPFEIIQLSISVIIVVTNEIIIIIIINLRIYIQDQRKKLVSSFAFRANENRHRLPFSI